ncbi:hypothetical protein AAC387_Pa07g1131 [Persea americana]
MPLFSSPPKIPNLKSFFLKFPSKPISFSSIPTHQDISHLILQQQSPSKALQTFRWASQLPNFSHSQSTYRALIHKLCIFRRFDTIKTILSEMPDSIGAPPDDDIFITIARGYGRARMTHQAINIPELVSQFGKNPSLKIFNSVLDVLVKEDIDLGRDFFRRKIMGCGVQGDEYTFGILMKGLCRTNRIDEGFRLLKLMKSRGLLPNSVIYNTLIHALCKNGKVGRGRSLMSEMNDPNAVTFNVLISGYCRDGDFVRALVLLEQCFNHGLIPDVVTITKVLELLCKNERVMEAFEVLERVEKRGGVVDIVAHNTLIKGFCNLGKSKVGLRILKEMESKGCLPNASTYNVLIAGFCDVGKLDEALDLFHEMRTDGIEPDFVTYDTMIKGLCSEGKVDDGFKILDMMEEGNQRERISPYNSIIYGLYRENRLEQAHDFLANMGRFFPRVVDRSFKILSLCKECKVGEAEKIYDQMVVEGAAPSALVYACLIDSLCKEEDVRRAFELMNEMVLNGYFPIPATFNALIIGFCGQGSVGNAITLMEEIFRRGGFADAGSYHPLIDTLCRRGNFQRALGLLVQMVEKGVVPDHLIWTSLLMCLLNRETIWLKSKGWLHADHLLDCICET